MVTKKFKNLIYGDAYLPYFIILFSLIVRIPIVYIFGDSGLQHEWSVLVNNLIDFGTLAFSYHDPNLDQYLLPNLYMPPLYAYYLYFFSFFSLEEQNFIFIILLSQTLLASISVLFFFKINRFFFSKQISLLNSLLFSIFPIHLYACSQISSISLQTFLTILYIYFFFKFIEKKIFSSSFLFSFIGGLIILLRQEFVVVLFLSFLYIFVFYKVSLKKIFLMFLIAFITTSPYLIRNILVFESVTIAKTTGYNLWKGSHPEAKGIEGSEIKDDNLREKISKIPKDKFYGKNYDNLFLNEAIKNIKNDPVRFLNLFVKKFFSFLFIDINSTAPNYYNPFHYLPVLFLGITSLIGIMLSDKKSYKLNYLIVVFFFYVLIFSTVSILPRYKLIVLPIQIIFTGVLIDKVKKFIS